MSLCNKFFHDLRIVFVTGLEPEAVMNDESLVLLRHELLVNVSIPTSDLGGYLEINCKMRRFAT
jgi:hypothetical protein